MSELNSLFSHFTRWISGSEREGLFINTLCSKASGQTASKKKPFELDTNINYKQENYQAKKQTNKQATNYRSIFKITTA